MAIGRTPRTADLNLSETSLELSRGFIKVDEYENTNVEGVHALGDVTTTGMYNEFEPQPKQ